MPTDHYESGKQGTVEIAQIGVLTHISSSRKQKMITTTDITSLFLSAMRQAGFEPDCTISADGKLHRFRDWLDKPGTRNGWYILFPDFPPAGAFGCWKRGVSERWSAAKGKFAPITSGHLASIEKILKGNHHKGQQEAVAIWSQASQANGTHRYLVAKKIRPHGIRYAQGALQVPVMDVNGQLHGLQRIYPDGRKRFTRFTNKRGYFYMLGTPGERIICIAEGFATAATIHEVTGHAVVAAFDSGNLLPVAENIMSAFPDHGLVLCADNDWRVEGNPGLTKAREAAAVVGGRVICPEFKNYGSHGTDFNDLFLEEGQDSVKTVILQNGGFKNVLYA